MFTRNTYMAEFSKLDRRARYWHWIVLFPKLFPKIKNTELRRAERNNFLRRFRAVHQVGSLILEGDTFPDIELLTVAAGKDISILPLTLKSAISNSLNPIKNITIICPKSDQEECSRILATLDFKIFYQVLAEDEIISALIREKINSKFPNRYGWIIQQFLKAIYICESGERGILLIDADTVLIKKSHWLDDLGNQILMPSLEFHRPYYVILETLLGLKSTPSHTFITHHMLFQPQKYRDILKSRGFDSAEDFLLKALELADDRDTSPLSVDFEPYAQGMFTDFKGFVALRKFSNFALPRNIENIEKVGDLAEARIEVPYNSISLHDYL